MSTPSLRLVSAADPDADVNMVDQYADRLFLTVADVASLTRTDPRTVRRAIEDGQIPSVRLGAVIRIPAAPFWQLCGLDLRQHEVGPTGADLDDSVPVEGAAHDQSDHTRPRPSSTQPRPS